MLFAEHLSHQRHNSLGSLFLFGKRGEPLIGRGKRVPLGTRSIERLTQVFPPTLVKLEEHAENRHRTVAGEAEHPDHAQAADLWRAIETISALWIAAGLDQPIPFPVAQHIDCQAGLPGGLTNLDESAAGGRGFLSPAFEERGCLFGLGAFSPYEEQVLFGLSERAAEIHTGGAADED